MRIYFIVVLFLLQFGGNFGSHIITPPPQESHCGCEDVIQAAITNATAQLERELAAIINDTIINATAQLERELAAIINDTIINATAQLERESSAKFQQQIHEYQELSQKIEGQNKQILSQYERLISSIEDTHHDAGTFQNPAKTCSDLPNDTTSGHYWVQSSQTGNPALVLCDMARDCCGSTGKWMRIANLDMTESTEVCPPTFRAVTSPRRLCGTHGRGCVSTTFPVHGVQYSHVCGRIKGYQYGSPDAFAPYYHHSSFTIDDLYVEGASLTHGQNPRNHIWTFAATVGDSYANVCRCTRTDTPYTGRVPPFIGEDYFCDTGNRNGWTRQYYLDDPLWDGAGCGPTSTCCEFNTPPWFCKALPQPTTDDIELRLCVDSDLYDEDVLLEQYEIFVQ